MSLVIVNWRTLGAHIGWDGQVVTYPDMEAARTAWSDLAHTADPGALGIIEVPPDWLADLGTPLRRWLGDAPARYVACGFQGDLDPDAMQPVASGEQSVTVTADGGVAATTGETERIGQAA